MMGEAEKTGGRYRIDARRGNFTVQAFAEGWLSFVGHNPTFAVRRYGGEIRFAGSEKVDSMLIIAEAESISLRDNVSEKDRAEIERATREDVLQIERFSEIVFVSKNVSLKQIPGGRFSVAASGFLSLHGETREQTIEAQAVIDNGSIHASGEFKLRQSDFNIEPVKALGGTLKVKDEVKISFDIMAQT